MNICNYAPRQKFDLFSIEHIIALIVTFTVFIVTILIMRNVKSEKGRTVFRYVFAFLMVAQELSRQVWYALVGHFDPSVMLPLHLCGILSFVGAAMLITKKQILYEICYFLGIGGAMQALVTPNAPFPFPHWIFFQFFVAHGFIVLSALYMTFVENCKPRRYPITLLRVFLITNAYLLLMYFINIPLDANYMFVSHKPVSKTIIDLFIQIFGPHPRYIIGLELMGIITITILYIPWWIRAFVIRFRKPQKS